MRNRVLGLTVVAATIACESTSPDPVAIQHRVATEIEVLSGSYRSGVAGEPIPAPVTLVVLDQIGRPLAEQEVTFEVTSGDGRFDVAVDTTDAEGVAQATWILGPRVDAAHLAEARVLSQSGRTIVARFEAFAEPGPFAALRVVGDTIVGIERLDTLVVDVLPYDAYGNPVADEPVSWDVSETDIATVDDGVVVGRGEGWVTVTASSGAASARLHAFVEGTRSTRYTVHVDSLAVAGDSMYAYRTSGTYPMQLGAWSDLWHAGDFLIPSGTSLLLDFEVARPDEFWGVFSVNGCSSSCQVRVSRSADGQAWTTHLELQDATGIELGVGANGEVVLVSARAAAGYAPEVLLFDGAAWVDLALPTTPPFGNGFHANDITVSANGDVYIAAHDGGMHPLIARYDGATWTVTGVPVDFGVSFGLEPSPDGVVYGRVDGFGVVPDRIIRIEGSSVEVLETPLEPAFIVRGLAAGPSGEVAIAYNRANIGGIVWSTPAGWEQWEYDGRMTPAAPVWHDGYIWFPATFPTTTVDVKSVVRLEPWP